MEERARHTTRGGMVVFDNEEWVRNQSAIYACREEADRVGVQGGSRLAEAGDQCESNNESESSAASALLALFLEPHV